MRIKSKVNKCLTIGSDTWRGVFGCSTKASFTLRLFMTAEFLLSRSRASPGRPVLLRSVSARSSLSDGFDAATTRTSGEVLWTASSSRKSGISGGTTAGELDSLVDIRVSQHVFSPAGVLPAPAQPHPQ